MFKVAFIIPTFEVLFAALVLALVPSASLSRQCVDVHQTDVLILGAGMAGISAGKTLSSRGIHKFLILEGGNDIGGRVKAAEFGGLKVEEGANWIHGLFGNGTSERNPIWPLAARFKLAGGYADYDDLVVYKALDPFHSTKVSEAELTAVLDQLYDGLDRIENLAISRQNDGKSDISFRTALRLSGWNPRSTDHLAHVLEWLKHDFSYLEPPQVTSLQNNLPLYTYEAYGHKDYFVTDQRGFSTIIKGLANEYLTPDYKSDPRLHLNEVVKKIEWGDSCVCATVEKSDNSSHTYCAKSAIHTFSVGVLQAGTVEFVPPLPDEKLVAINNLDFGYYLKIFALFNTSFWDDNEYIGHGSFQRGYYPAIQPLNAHNGKYFPSKTPVLIFTVTSFQAVRVSTQPKQVTISEIYEVLKSMYGDSAQMPVDILVPDWIQNPLFHGTYTIFPTGYTDEMYQNFVKPAGALVFSGEASSRKDYAYLHGAYLSGITAAHHVVAKPYR